MSKGYSLLLNTLSLAMFMLLGCARDRNYPTQLPSQPETESHVESPQENSGTPRSPVDNVSITPEESLAIAAAKRYLEQSSGNPIDADFHAKKSDRGFDVFVQYIYRDEQGRPGMIAGGHSLVRLSNDYKVIDVVPGS